MQIHYSLKWNLQNKLKQEKKQNTYFLFKIMLNMCVYEQRLSRNKGKGLFYSVWKLITWINFSQNLHHKFLFPNYSLENSS